MAAQFRTTLATKLLTVVVIAGFAGYGLRALTEIAKVESANKDNATVANDANAADEQEPASDSLAHRRYTYDEVIKCISDGKSLCAMNCGLADRTVACDESLIVRCYSVGDLISPHGTTPVLTSQSFDQLIDLIVAAVEHGSWMENGRGSGEIQPFPSKNSLVIAQTERVHQQIADLLEQLRQMQDSSAKL